MRRIVILMALMMFLVNAIPSYTFALGPNTVDSAAIVDGQVKTADINALAVTTEKIADGAITTGKLAGWSVNSSKIVDYSITDTKMSSNAVITSKIQDGAVTNTKISGPVDAEKIKQYTNVYTVAKGVQEGNGTYSTIQAAINAATAAGGVYLVRVMPGQYTEDISINGADIYLQGSGSETTEIRPATANGTAVTIVNSWGYLSGLSFGSNGNSRGISITDSEITIKDNTFRVGGIAVTNSAVNIEKNSFFNIENSVYVDSSSTWADLTIVDNSFIGDRNCSTSIHVNYNSAGTNLNALNNRFEGLQCSSFYIRNSDSTVIKNNYIKGASTPNGIQVKGNDIVIEGNYLTNNLSDGIYVEGVTNKALIKNNIIVNGGKGIDILSGVSGALIITNNQITGNTVDIRNSSSITPNINFNVFDTYQGFTPSHLNLKSDGTPW